MQKEREGLCGLTSPERALGSKDMFSEGGWEQKILAREMGMDKDIEL